MPHYPGHPEEADEPRPLDHGNGTLFLAWRAVDLNRAMTLFGLIGFFILNQLGLYFHVPPGFGELANLVVTAILALSILETVFTGRRAPQPPRRGLLWGLSWRYGVLVLIVLLPLWVMQTLLAPQMSREQLVRLMLIVGPVSLPIIAWLVFSLAGTWLSSRVRGGGGSPIGVLRRGIADFGYVAPRLAFGPGLMMLVANMAGLTLVALAPSQTGILPDWAVIGLAAAFGMVTAVLNTGWVVLGAAILSAAQLRAEARQMERRPS